MLHIYGAYLAKFYSLSFLSIRKRHGKEYATPIIHFICLSRFCISIVFNFSLDGCPGFYLGFIVWGRSPEWPKATSFLGGSGGTLPWKFFEMNMRWDAIWCILRPNFEKCYSGILFFSRDHVLPMLHLAPIFLRGKLGILGGKLLPLKYPR